MPTGDLWQIPTGAEKGSQATGPHPGGTVRLTFSETLALVEPARPRDGPPGASEWAF